jgi:hypothetical protein
MAFLWWDVIPVTVPIRLATLEQREECVSLENKFAAEINKFADEIRAIGPNPIRL